MSLGSNRQLAVATDGFYGGADNCPPGTVSVVVVVAEETGPIVTVIEEDTVIVVLDPLCTGGSMSAVNPDALEVYRNIDKRLVYQLLQGDNVTPYDLSLATVHLGISVAVGQVPPDIERTAIEPGDAEGIEWVDAVNGTFRVTILEADSQTLAAGDYVFDVVVVLAAGGGELFAEKPRAMVIRDKVTQAV